MKCQGQPQLLHLSSPDCLPELWPWIWPVESVALPLSSGRHTPGTAPAHPDVRAQPCVDCATQELQMFDAFDSLRSCVRAIDSAVRFGRADTTPVVSLSHGGRL